MIPGVGRAISRSQPKRVFACSETWPSFVNSPSLTSSASAAFRAASRAAALTVGDPAPAKRAAENSRRWDCSAASDAVAVCWTAALFSLVARIPSGMTATPLEGGGLFSWTSVGAAGSSTIRSMPTSSQRRIWHLLSL